MLVCQTGGSGSTNSVKNNFASSDVGPGQYNQSTPNYQVRTQFHVIYKVVIFKFYFHT